MTATALDNYRRVLLDLQRRTTGDISHLADEALRSGGEASGTLSHTPIHMADLGTDNYEQELTLGLLQNEAQLAEEIAAALARVARGTFGTCEDCGQPIPKVRLSAMPYTRTCIDCARRRENGGEHGSFP